MSNPTAEAIAAAPAPKAPGHTPAPWTYRESDGTILAGDIPVAGVYDNTDDGTTSMDDEPSGFNGILIAAAPDLLEALRVVVASGPLNNGMRDDNSLSVARAAIAKATTHAA